MRADNLCLSFICVYLICVYLIFVWLCVLFRVVYVILFGGSCVFEWVGVLFGGFEVVVKFCFVLIVFLFVCFLCVGLLFFVASREMQLVLVSLLKLI